MKFRSILAFAFVCLLMVGLIGKADGQTWTALNNQPPVGVGAMLLLTDGRVLVHNENSDFTAWYTLTPDINGSYVNGTWQQVASLPNGYAPLYFASAVLPDGKVVIQGGEYQCPDANCADAWQSLGALYDPVANTWTATTPPIPNTDQAFGDVESVVLPNGTWMVAACCMMGSGQNAFPEYFYFDESTLSFTQMGSLTAGKADDFDEEGWTLLPDGNVLTVDAYWQNYIASGKNSELYNPATNQWTTAGSTIEQLWDSCNGASSASYEVGPGVLMPSGTVFYTGSSSCAAGNTSVYDVSTGTWAAGPSFPNNSASQQVSVDDGPASVEVNGNVVVMASPSNPEYSTPSAFYEWNGSTLTAFPNPANAVNDGSYYGHLLVLPTGQILFTDFSGIVEVLTSAGTYDSAWQPTVTTTLSPIYAGQTYQIQGTQFNGLSGGAAYGDDFEDNTNYPLVRIVNNTSGNVFYAKTHGHSTMGVATGSTPVSTYFDVPAATETGPCELYVVANGIPSNAVACNVSSAPTTLPAALISPNPGTALGSSTATFTWNSGFGVTSYWLTVGTGPSGANAKNLYAGAPTTALSATVTGLPIYGQTVYVTLSSKISGAWQSTAYQFTASGSPVPAALTSPTPGSQLTGTSVNFTWSPGGGVTNYLFNLGTTASGVGAKSIYSGSSTTATSLTIGGLPTNGETLYVTLYSQIAGVFQPTVCTFYATGQAVLTSPAPGSKLGASATFVWTPGTGITKYWFNLGTANAGVDTKNIYSGGPTTATSLTVSGIPQFGETLYATLYSYISGAWQPIVYTYSASGSPVAATLTIPAPSTKLTSSSVTFNWSAGEGIANYWLNLGTADSGANAKNLYSGSSTTLTSVSATGLPTNGETIYATLYSYIAGAWQPTVYSYTASGSPTPAALTTPSPTTQLTSSTVTFTWSPGSGVTHYWFNLGTGSSGTAAKNLYSGASTTATSVTVTGLPTNSEPIYATLYSYIAGAWQPTVYTYTAQ